MRVRGEGIGEPSRVRIRLSPLRGIYVEADPEMCSKLRKALNPTGTHPDIREGPIQQHLGQILNDVRSAPLLAFFDPFGRGIPFDILTEQVLARATAPRPAKTEVILNLSVPGIHRNAGHLKEPTTTDPRYLKARPTILKRLDASLGGDWWRETWATGAKKERIDQIVEGYWDRVKRAAGGWGSWRVPVSDRWGGPPSYYLIFLSKHPDGLWEFAQALSRAMEVYYEHCHRDQLPLETQQERWARWVDEIAHNLEQLLASGVRFQVRSRLPDICGETLGLARERHIRAAIKRLYKEGKTSTTGVGDVASMWIEPPTAASGARRAG